MRTSVEKLQYTVFYHTVVLYRYRSMTALWPHANAESDDNTVASYIIYSSFLPVHVYKVSKNYTNECVYELNHNYITQEWKKFEYTYMLFHSYSFIYDFVIHIIKGYILLLYIRNYQKDKNKFYSETYFSCLWILSCQRVSKKYFTKYYYDFHWS